MSWISMLWLACRTAAGQRLLESSVSRAAMKLEATTPSVKQSKAYQEGVPAL